MRHFITLFTLSVIVVGMLSVTFPAPVHANAWDDFWDDFWQEDPSYQEGDILNEPSKGNVWKLMQNGGLNEVGNRVYGGTGKVDIRVAVVTIIRLFLSFLGIIAVVLNIYAGFQWMTAGGNEEQVTQAKALLRNAAIGLFVIFISYALTTFVFRILLVATTTTGS